MGFLRDIGELPLQQPALDLAGKAGTHGGDPGRARNFKPPGRRHGENAVRRRISKDPGQTCQASKR